MPGVCSERGGDADEDEHCSPYPSGLSRRSAHPGGEDGGPCDGEYGDESDPEGTEGKPTQRIDRETCAHHDRGTDPGSGP